MRVENVTSVENRAVKLSCDHICKTFFQKAEENEVLRDISLSIRDNEFVVLLGPGQCGKTTLIKILAGLDSPTRGAVYAEGKQVTQPGIERGVVYQTTALFPWLTVRGNVEFGPSARGLSRKETRQISDYYINLVGLSGFEKSYPKELSGGMRQRVGIARAYANNPAVMLLDEPFGHLDAQTRYLMQEELIRIWEQEKRAVVFVTNNIEEAVYLADRIVILTGKPSQIKCEITVDLPRPRDYVSPAFLEMRERITDLIDKTYTT